MNTHPTKDEFAYDLIAEAIRHLEDNAADHPSLDDLARRMGVSPTHFQKMFSQWVGVSPKRYLQYLTLDHAKALLRDRLQKCWVDTAATGSDHLPLWVELDL